MQMDNEKLYYIWDRYLWKHISKKTEEVKAKPMCSFFLVVLVLQEKGQDFFKDTKEQ